MNYALGAVLGYRHCIDDYTRFLYFSCIAREHRLQLSQISSIWNPCLSAIINITVYSNIHGLPYLHRISRILEREDESHTLTLTPSPATLKISRFAPKLGANRLRKYSNRELKYPT